MMLFDDYIEVGLVDYTDKFLDAMKNWQKYDYSYDEKLEKEILQENYAYYEKHSTSTTKKKEECYNRYLKKLDNAKKSDEKRNHVK